MNTLSGQSIQEYGQSGYQGLTLTRRHLGNLALVEGNTTNKLHIVMDHIPYNLVSAGNPTIAPYSVISLNGNEILHCCKVPVKIQSLYHNLFVLLETARGRLHYCKSIG
ncbi:hypothetical protein SDC9_62159 [bioreactor metagenome]|uniref:Uncharacterized protein n=1 Tax=bioreactor metagenome TaxID=1076179 RepID=A0A644XIK8_9ZZZZ